jgi:arylsulfatase A-like enzyme
MKMKKLSFLLFLAPTILLLFQASYSNSAKQSKAKQPNIIFIMADDMGYSDIGCYGGEISTPNIDQLAANGIKLRNFYNNARCCPTRAALLTGEYPHTVGMGYMVTQAKDKIKPGHYQGFLDDKYPTIAEELKLHGYNTYMAGKWHVGERPEHWPLKRGFEHYFGLISGASSYYEIIPAEKGKRHIVLDDQDITPPTGFYMTDAFTDHAMGFLDLQKKENPGKPFFLYLAYTAPHFPLHAYESDIAKYENLYQQGWDVTREKRYQKMTQLGLIDARYQLTPRPEDIPAWDSVTDKDKWVRKMATYAAMIDRMDQNIGKLVASLKANGQFDNTLIIFISDNGSSPENTDNRNFNDPNSKIGARGSYVTYDTPWANVSNTPFKKYKKYLHEGGIVSPCIVHYPAKIKPKAGFVDGIGHVMDLFPTALELAGVPAKKLPGLSLTYLWNRKTPPSRTYCWEHEGNQAIRQGNWKLVKDTDDADWALYDLKTDPCETKNVAGKWVKEGATLKAEYESWAQQVGVRAVTSAKSE